MRHPYSKTNDGTRQRGSLFDAQPLGHGARRDIAHDNLQRDDLDRPDQLFPHIDTLDEVCRHPNRGEARHEELAQAIVEHALAINHIPFFCVEGRGIVLEILDERSWLWALVQNFSLAFRKALRRAMGSFHHSRTVAFVTAAVSALAIPRAHRISRPFA